ncbi:uncharacterized protein LOC121425854 [Lytechinus variegatus]|uniref:uncharacterized protein LOC121425854 n=1 Tax=Lytechinus variegatus TaxID=7654 RepID=UPI001BB1A0E2|nr:uncharacterized protein LOC121425854 [Lytechinus variegatus]
MEQDRSAKATSTWRLGKSGGAGGSSSDCNSSAGSSGSEGTDGVFVFVNGRRAQSKRTGKVFGQLTGIKRNSDVFEMRTSDGASLKMPVGDLDTDSLGEEFGVDLDNLEGNLQPLLHSTPYLKKRSNYQQRKRVKSSRNASKPDNKYKGCIQVPISLIRKAPPGYTLVTSNPAKVESFKSELRANPHHHIPVLPVMVHDEHWMKENGEDAEYFLLGGYSLWEAIVDLADNERFAHYNRCMVNVHAGLSEVEALEVGATFQQHQSLLRDEVPDLEGKVKMCRRLLFTLHDLDEDLDEPPSTVKDDWRKQAAAALGCMSSPSVDGRKPLEPLFQLALYSRRCYSKLTRLFAIHLENTGKPMKISIFLQLQGMTESERFNLLSRLVAGELQPKEIKGEALKIKRMALLQRTMKTLTKSKTWEECVERYPVHTQNSALEQFLGKDMRKSIPQEFVNYIREAEETMEGEYTSLEELQTSPVVLTVIEAKSTKGLKQHVKKVKEATSQLAALTENITTAAEWISHMKRSGFKIVSESVVVNDSNARHLIVGGQQDVPGLPKVIQESSCYRILLETYTKPQDEVACFVQNTGTFDDEARSMERVSRRLCWFLGDSSREESLPSNYSSDDYEFIE